MDNDRFAVGILRFGKDDFASVVPWDVVQENGNAGQDAKRKNEKFVQSR